MQSFKKFLTDTNILNQKGLFQEQTYQNMTKIDIIIRKILNKGIQFNLDKINKI